MSNMLASTVSSYPGAWAKFSSSWRASCRVSFQGRLRSIAKNRLRPEPEAVTSVATGASRVATVRPPQLSQSRLR
jgi:hypothetical protein